MFAQLLTPPLAPVLGVLTRRYAVDVVVANELAEYKRRVRLLSRTLTRNDSSASAAYEKIVVEGAVTGDAAVEPVVHGVAIKDLCLSQAAGGGGGGEELEPRLVDHFRRLHTKYCAN